MRSWARAQPATEAKRGSDARACDGAGCGAQLEQPYPFGHHTPSGVTPLRVSRGASRRVEARHATLAVNSDRHIEREHMAQQPRPWVATFVSRAFGSGWVALCSRRRPERNVGGEQRQLHRLRGRVWWRWHHQRAQLRMRCQHIWPSGLATASVGVLNEKYCVAPVRQGRMKLRFPWGSVKRRRSKSAPVAVGAAA